MRKVFFPILALLLAVGLAVSMAAPVAADVTGNLLINPDAETGDMTGWTHSTGQPFENPNAKTFHPQDHCETVIPNSGSYFFAMGLDEAVSTSWMKQEIDLTGLAGTPVCFEASGWVQTEAWDGGGGPAGEYDYGALIVEFYDSGDVFLGGATKDPVEYPICGPSEYGEFSMTGAVPAGAAYAVYKLEGHRIQQTYINVFYDDLSFTVETGTDADGDGYYIEGGVCLGPVDCDDSDPDVYPGAEEICDGKDNDCDGQVDEDNVCGEVVGGTVVPTDKLGLAMPWMTAAALIVIAGMSLALWNRKRATQKAPNR